ITLSIATDVEEWAGLTFWKSWYLRHEIAVKIIDHEEDLKELTESISLATRLQIADLQESLKSTPGIAERKRALELLYQLKSDPPGEFSDATPAELACECARIGIQVEHSGARNDIWKGRWLDKEDLALIFSKEYKMAARDHGAIQILEIAKGLGYLHAENIIHGSVQPSNILINDDGRAVLSDFSLSQPAIVGAKNIQINPQ
ncbi:hypothetical protein FRC00_013295, partial [Tulasnella sp. 408]